MRLVKFQTRHFINNIKSESERYSKSQDQRARFNSRLQVTELAIGHGVNNGDLWKLGYEYGEVDGNGNLDIAKNTGNVARQTLSFAGLTNPFVQTYKYDSLYRLTEARETNNGGQTWKQGFSYDRYGNRLTHDRFSGANLVTQTSVTHPTIDENTNRFTSGQGYGEKRVGHAILRCNRSKKERPPFQTASSYFPIE